jgi:enoyl-CoA hydratase/carnithine racemase
MKRNMNCAESGGLAELLDMANMVQTARTEDHREAASAFVERRPGFRQSLNSAVPPWIVG